MKSKFYANIELGGEITQVSFQATSASDVINKSGGLTVSPLQLLKFGKR